VITYDKIYFILTINTLIFSRKG